MDLKWNMDMLSMWLNKFYKKTGKTLKHNSKAPAGFDMEKIECFTCPKNGNFARECRSKGGNDSSWKHGKNKDAWYKSYKVREAGKKHEESKALAIVDGVGLDWNEHDEDDSDSDQDHALTADIEANMDDDDSIDKFDQAISLEQFGIIDFFEVHTFTTDCKTKYSNLNASFDIQRERLGDYSVHVQAYE